MLDKDFEERFKKLKSAFNSNKIEQLKGSYLTALKLYNDRLSNIVKANESQISKLQDFVQDVFEKDASKMPRNGSIKVDLSDSIQFKFNHNADTWMLRYLKQNDLLTLEIPVDGLYGSSALAIIIEDYRRDFTIQQVDITENVKRLDELTADLYMLYYALDEIIYDDNRFTDEAMESIFSAIEEQIKD